MPIHSCRKNGLPGYKFGESGACYTYEPGNETGRKEAKRKAFIQKFAIEKSGFTENDYKELAKLLTSDKLQQNSLLDLLKGFWSGLEKRFTNINETIWTHIWHNGVQEAHQSGVYRTAMQNGRLPSSNRWTQEYFQKHGLELVKTLTQTDIDRFRTLMSDPDNWNLGKDQFVRLLDDSWPVSPERAGLIFENEKAVAYREGSKDYMEKELKPTLSEKDLIMNTWHHGGSAHPREYHLQCNGETVEEGQQFSNGLEYPGSNGDIIGCKCWLSYEKKLNTSKVP